jgi:hypothetical protein
MKQFLVTIFGLLTISTTVFGNTKILIEDKAWANMTLGQEGTSVSPSNSSEFTKMELDNAKSGNRFIISDSYYCLQAYGFRTPEAFALDCARQQHGPNPTQELKVKGSNLCISVGAKVVKFYKFKNIKSLGVSNGGGAERVDIVLGLDMACQF